MHVFTALQWAVLKGFIFWYLSRCSFSDSVPASTPSQTPPQPQHTETQINFPPQASGVVNADLWMYSASSGPLWIRCTALQICILALEFVQKKKKTGAEIFHVYIYVHFVSKHVQLISLNASDEVWQRFVFQDGETPHSSTLNSQIKRLGFKNF